MHNANPRKTHENPLQIQIGNCWAFSLALWQAEGLMASGITLMDLTISAPDHTTISRRAVTLPVIQAASVPHGPLHLLIDSSGLQVYGAGQWLEAKHGAKSRRKWRKLHLAGIVTLTSVERPDAASRYVVSTKQRPGRMPPDA